MTNNGVRGEELFREIMLGRGYNVEDVREDEWFQRRDIDFVVSFSSGSPEGWEVKWDSWINKTGNLYLEFISPRSLNCEGWFEFIGADYLAYGDATAEKFYVINVEWLKDYVERHKNLFEIKECGDGSIGYLVPLKNLIYKEL